MRLWGIFGAMGGRRWRQTGVREAVKRARGCEGRRPTTRAAWLARHSGTPATAQRSLLVGFGVYCVVGNISRLFWVLALWPLRSHFFDMHGGSPSWSTIRYSLPLATAALSTHLDVRASWKDDGKWLKSDFVHRGSDFCRFLVVKTSGDSCRHITGEFSLVENQIEVHLTNSGSLP